MLDRPNQQPPGLGSTPRDGLDERPGSWLPRRKAKCLSRSGKVRRLDINAGTAVTKFWIVTREGPAPPVRIRGGDLVSASKPFCGMRRPKAAVREGRHTWRTEVAGAAMPLCTAATAPDTL